MRRKHPFWLLSLFLSFTLLAAACGGDDGGGETTATTVADEAVPKGGTLVIGAEQEPECLDWVASCAAASWGYWMMNVTTLPRVFHVVKQGDAWRYAATDLVTKAPELTEGAKPTITYAINPKAVWSDNTPITSKDFKYTWQEVTTGKGIYDTTGYRDIEAVDDSDPKTAVVTFKKSYADYEALFGGNYGLLPAHLLQGKNRTEVLDAPYTFSGGPWKIQSWERGTSATLIPNENFWGEKPNLDKIVYRFITDTSAEFQAFKSGESMVIYPQPQVDVVDQIKAGLGDAKSEFTPDTGNLEALWFNNSVAPFNDDNFRKAFGYAIDRQPIVERLFGALDVKVPMNTMNAPILEKYADTDAWTNYKKDLAKVTELMTAGGWTKGSDGLWAKGGQKATVEMKTTAGNKRRELTEQIIQEQAKRAGFDVKINNQKAGDLFGTQLPRGQFQVALYASVLTSLHPTSCVNFCSANTPTAANQFSGNNYPRVDDDEIDRLGAIVDSSLEDAEVVKAAKAIDARMAEQNYVLPLDPLPNILLWSSRVLGPLEPNPIMGPFYNAHLWGVRQ